MVEDQYMYVFNHIMSERRSKHAWSYCVLHVYVTLILHVSQNEIGMLATYIAPMCNNILGINTCIIVRFNLVIKWIDSEKLFKKHEVVGNNYGC